MRITTIPILLIAAGALAISAFAQSTQAPSTVTRTVVAATKLASVVETPIYFRALHVSVSPRQTSTLSVANGVLYQISGSAEISAGGELIADRVVRLQMAAAAARLYPKVLAFWEEVLGGTATYDQDGKRFLKYTTEDRFEATRMIMAYGFGKPVQPLAGAFQEQTHRTLEVRWMPSRPDDHSKAVDLAPGE